MQLDLGIKYCRWIFSYTIIRLASLTVVSSAGSFFLGSSQSMTAASSKSNTFLIYIQQQREYFQVVLMEEENITRNVCISFCLCIFIHVSMANVKQYINTSSGLVMGQCQSHSNCLAKFPIENLGYFSRKGRRIKKTKRKYLFVT